MSKGVLVLNLVSFLLSWTSPNLCLIFSQGAARKLATQRKNIEVVESVGIAGKSDSDRKVKYFRLEVRLVFLFPPTYIWQAAVLNEYKVSVGFLIETANCNIVISLNGSNF